MEITQAIYILLVGIGAGFVQRVSGFGLGIFAMLFLPHFMPTHAAAATVSCLCSCGTSTYNAVKYRKKIPFRVILPLIFTALIIIPVGVHFSIVLPVAILRRILGIVLILLSIFFLFFHQSIRIKPTLGSSLLAGGIGGALNGLFSTGGPPIVIYLTQAVTDNIVYFAGIQFYFSVTNIYATVVRLINGVLTWELLYYAAIGFLGCITGDFIGRGVFHKMNAETLKRTIYIGMIISGIIMIL